MYEYEKKQIQQMEKKIADIRNQARTDGRPMNKVEAGIVSELEDAVHDLKMQLPVGDPETRTNSKHTPARVKGGFNSLGEQLVAVAMAGTPGREPDRRLYNAASGLNETVSSEGGFLVQSDFSYQLLQGIFETGVLASRCNRIQISGNANSINLPAVDETSRATGSRWGGIRSYWIAEADQKTASKPKIRSMELNLKKLTGLCYATDEVLADAKILETVIRQGFSDEFGFMLDDAIVNGSGAGMPLGFMNSGALVTISKESGQADDTIAYENVMKMFAAMPARNRRNAVWLINQAIEPQLYGMTLAIGTAGQPVFLPAAGASERPYASLFGRPVIPIEQAAALGDLGDICFCDLSQYVLAEKGGLQSDMSIHVRFEYGESLFRFILRVDGQPNIASPITPYKGAQQLSPFVTLEAR